MLCIKETINAKYPLEFFTYIRTGYTYIHADLKNPWTWILYNMYENSAKRVFGSTLFFLLAMLQDDFGIKCEPSERANNITNDEDCSISLNLSIQICICNEPETVKRSIYRCLFGVGKLRADECDDARASFPLNSAWFRGARESANNWTHSLCFVNLIYFIPILLHIHTILHSQYIFSADTKIM